MNRLERFDDPEAAMLAVLRGWQAGLYTAMPAIIDSFDPDKETCEAHITIQAKVTDRNGVESWQSLPKLVDVPVVFPGGGGYTLTFPVGAGDEALIVFASRCIDAWWQSGGVQVQADLRMQDLSDGFAFVGIKSQPRVLAGGVKTTGAQLRSDDGLNYVEVGAGTIKLKSATSVIIDTPATTVTGTLLVQGATTLVGDLLAQGAATITKVLSYLAGLSGAGGAGGSSNITGDITHTGGNLSSNGKVLHTHTHHVTAAPGNTDPPT